MRFGSVRWGRKEEERKGIAVIFGWNWKEDEPFLHLCSSLGWNSLLSHSHFLTPFYPDMALSLAFTLLHELLKELKVRPCPVVFVALSATPKASMFKLFQIIQGTCEGHYNLDEIRLLRNCVSGHIYDSSSVNFTTDLGAQFTIHPAVQKMTGPSKLVSWFAKTIVSGLDSLYLTKFESQRTEYWQSLCSSVEFGAPYLILCSESDHLAPYKSICRFAQRLQNLGGDIKLVKWSVSPHIGHYKNYPIQYRAAVTNLLERAVSVFYQRIQRLREGVGLDGAHDEISELICNLQTAADNSNQSLRRVAVGPGDHFFVPAFAGNHNNRESETMQDGKKEVSVYSPTTPCINANSLLGQMLFDVCVPKNVEGWDIRFSGSVNGHPIGTAHCHSPPKGLKCIRRSRL